ncbi:hypothetical protein [Cytobacillus oceanisediminis]|nr:hypothetical protein [Cytobacillus oceanisediminis]
MEENESGCWVVVLKRKDIGYVRRGGGIDRVVGVGEERKVVEGVGKEF